MKNGETVLSLHINVPFPETILFLAKSHLFPTRIIGPLHLILSLINSIFLTAYWNEEVSTTENTTITASTMEEFLLSWKKKEIKKNVFFKIVLVKPSGFFILNKGICNVYADL